MKAESWIDKFVAELKYSKVSLEEIYDGNVEKLIQDISEIGELFFEILEVNS